MQLENRLCEVKRLQNRLLELIKIFGDEEDEEVVAIREKAIENFKKVLNQCNNSLLKDWQLFSNNMGVLSLEYMRNGFRSLICIGETHITYFVSNENNGTRITGQEPFNSDSIESLLKKVQGKSNMKNIFENAYFGKAYKTVNGELAIYSNYDGDYDVHRVLLDGGYFLSYDKNGHVNMLQSSTLDDIVSEWQEPIDEEELDKYAKKYAIEEYQYELIDSDVDVHCCIEDFKAGYRTAKNEKTKYKNSSYRA